ncbi:MAG TPA: hypothetical protein VK928_01695 [Longimicrobiales bacterium]|nr:hypothetical protein [Longimicrobiales bacterium]
MKSKFATRRRHTLLTGLALVLAACGGGGGPTEPAPEPLITIGGVADGQTYPGPVTITVSIDRGTYEITLNGEAILSGRTVSDPGAYTLIVTARNGGTTATRQVAFTIAAPAGGVLLVRMLNLGPNEMGGGGDAILVTDSSGTGLRHALVDAGPAGASASDPGYVARRLGALGVDTLAFMLLTHAHSDHFQGMTDVLNQVKVRQFYYNGSRRSLSFYQNLLTLAGQRADTVIVLTDTAGVQLGGSRFTLVPPLPTYLNQTNASSDEENEGSLGALLRRATFEMFFTGDGEYEANARWRTQFATLTRNVDVLKVGHHGANNAIFDSGSGGASTWLEHTNPSISVISSNGVTHPRLAAIDRLLSRTNMRTYCTSVHGEITIRVLSTGSHAVTVERNANANCVRGTQATT